MVQDHDIQEGQIIEADGCEFKVSSKDVHQIKRIEICKIQLEQQTATP
ncbi:hypothetical protein [Bacillus sp. OTU530]